MTYNILVDAGYLESLELTVAAFSAAARKFIAKVENGKAHSVVTYSELLGALQLAESAERLRGT